MSLSTLHRTATAKCAALLAVLLLGAAHAHAQTSPAPIVAQAQIEVRNGNYLAAINRLRGITDLGTRKEKSTTLFWLGLAKFRQSQELVAKDDAAGATRLRAEAAGHFQQGIEMFSENGFNYGGLGMVQAAQNEFAKARPNLDKAVSLAGGDLQLLISIADAYTQATQNTALPEATRTEARTEAKTLLTKAETIDNNNADIKIALGNLYLAQGVMQLAETYYKQALEKQPNNARAHHMLGRAIIRQGLARAQEALNAFVAAKGADANYAPVLLDLATLYMTYNKPDLAKQELQAYRSLLTQQGADVKYATVLYGLNLYLTGNYAEAATELGSVIRDTNSVTIQRIYGYSLSASGKGREGVEALNKYMQMTQQEPNVRLAKDFRYLGYAQIMAGDTANGLQNLQKAQQMDASMQGIGRIMADVYKAQQKWDLFVPAQLQAYRDSSKLTDLFNAGFYAYTRLKNYRLADSIFGALIPATVNQQTGAGFIDAFYYRALNASAWEVDDTTKRGMALEHFQALDKQVQLQPTLAGAKKTQYLKSVYDYTTRHHYNRQEWAPAFDAIKKLKEVDPAHALIGQIYTYLEGKAAGR